jgi:hypothetical protein
MKLSSARLWGHLVVERYWGYLGSPEVLGASGEEVGCLGVLGSLRVVFEGIGVSCAHMADEDGVLHLTPQYH